MNMKATFINEDKTQNTYEGEQAWLMLLARCKPYAGAPQLKQIPATKKNYRGKNPAGGHKAVFSQSKAYHHGYTPTARPWYGLHAHLKQGRQDDERQSIG